MQYNIMITCHLDQILRDLSISQSELARMTGVTQPGINQYCLNKKLPELRTAYSIARALQLPVTTIWEVTQ